MLDDVPVPAHRIPTTSTTLKANLMLIIAVFDNSAAKYSPQMRVRSRSIQRQQSIPRSYKSEDVNRNKDPEAVSEFEHRGIHKKV